ncbi:DUF1707 domain-containing protein [Trebonia sp.]|uniref:DUF1707 SHOCT-like domain-containing protein n=1 Tax=Trebonia sp. TaxID=2767075 RepID=UPI00262C14DD|nr:DUF1707 domain-containing protein [Trebonia sp.]
MEMETGPGGRGAAAGWLRASDADRERVVALLQAAFVEGLLTRDEFGDRVGGALTALTYADLATLTADIPAGAAPMPQRAARAAAARSRPRPGRRAVAGGCTLVTGAVMMTDAALTGSGAGPTANLFYLLFILAFLVAFVSWLCAVSAHRGDATAGHPPHRQPPGAIGEAAPRQAATPARQSVQDGQAGQAGQAGHGTAQDTPGYPARMTVLSRRRAAWHGAWIGATWL